MEKIASEKSRFFQIISCLAQMFRQPVNPMNEKRVLYEHTLDMLEKCNFLIDDDIELADINAHLSSVLQSINNTLIKSAISGHNNSRL